jgi:hypothetical protein
VRRHSAGIILLALIVFLGVARATAGSNYAGFRGGVNQSSLKGDDPAEVEAITRPMGGFVGLFGLTHWLSFQCELLWSGRGTKGTIPIQFFGEETVVGTVELNYLEIPLLLRFTPRLNNRWRPYVCAGPSVAANLSAKVSGTFGGGDPLPVSASDGIDEIVTDGDLLLMAGVGLDVVLEHMALELDTRYSKGLLSVDESRRTVDPKNRAWTFSLALLLPLGE